MKETHVLPDEIMHPVYQEPQITARVKRKTGTWRYMRPVIKEGCNLCGSCWFFCPDGSIIKDKGHFSIDLEFCKGCGICAEECPLGVIAMEKE